MKTNVSRETIYHETEFCVVGGGLAGLCAAVAAARKGIKTILVQERPVLGGNASSEIRMWVRGAHGKYNMESGIVSELNFENIHRNPYLNFSIWDTVMYSKAINEPNLTLMLNTTCIDAEAENGHIESITCWQMTTYTFHTIHAEQFADCSGDSILAPLVGAKWTKGREASAEFGESIEPEQADLRTMGMSCLIQARELTEKVPFVKPEWAYTYETDDDLPHRGHSMQDKHNNFWWIELGGEDDSIRDTEKLRHELLKVAFGVWDHIKNRGDHDADNWELEWVGFLPGKRESRRYRGAHVLSQTEVEAGGKFEDTVAYGGWSMDDHNPAGFRHAGEPTIYHPAPSPFGIPFRSLYSANIDNLMFAGRNISATHAALSATRVMATCAIMGQAVGNAAAICVKYNCTPDEVSAKHIQELQNELMYDGCYLPGFTRTVDTTTVKAESNLTSEERELLFNGNERPSEQKPVGTISRGVGESIEFTYEVPVEGTVRLILDPDYSRESVHKNEEYRRYSMRSNVPQAVERMKMPANLAKKLEVAVIRPDGSKECLYASEENDQHLLFLPTKGKVQKLVVRFEGAWQSEESRVYSLEIDTKHK